MPVKTQPLVPMQTKGAPRQANILNTIHTTESINLNFNLMFSDVCLHNRTIKTAIKLG